MKTVTVNCAYFPVLLVLSWLWVGHCVNSSTEIFYPFDSDEGDTIVAVVGDDVCDGPVLLPLTVFKQRTMFVCTNGLVSFGRRLKSSSFESLRRSKTNVPFISPNWFDFTTTLNNNNSNRVYYRSMMLDKSTSEITEQQRCRDLGFCTALTSLIFVVTWHDIIAFTNTGHTNLTLNAFQLIVTSDKTRHFITFNYAKLHDRGMAGYDSRDHVDYYYFGSNVNLVKETNVGRPGRWTFSVSSGTRLAGTTMRLADSGNPLQGRLEVLYRGVWGTVCDDNFDDNATKVACYTMGFGHVGRYMKNAYGQGSGVVWLDDVRCNGTETDISQCLHNGWGLHDCSRYEAVSIACNPTTPEQVSVRLAGGSEDDTGRVEILYNDTWGTVCNNSFTDAAAKVICRMLNMDYARMYYGRTVGGTGQIWLDGVRCGGQEKTITECVHNGWGNTCSNHSTDVWITCYNYEYNDDYDYIWITPIVVVFTVMLLCVAMCVVKQCRGRCPARNHDNEPIVLNVVNEPESLAPSPPLIIPSAAVVEAPTYSSPPTTPPPRYSQAVSTDTAANPFHEATNTNTNGDK